jgi:hypothetical protein
MFVDRYARAANSADLTDDEHHHQTQVLRAAEFADGSGSDAVIGSILSRVKYGDAVPRQVFESGTMNLAPLIKIWTKAVFEKGVARKWLPVPRTEWDATARARRYERVALQSLALAVRA